MLWWLLAVACGPRFEVAPRALVAPEADFFTDIGDASGIRVDNFEVDPRPGVVINDHSRLAFADLDGDGFDDIVMHSLFPNVQNGVPYEHLVFLNNGDGTFTHFSDDSGLRDVQAAFFAFADVDNDGDQDLFAGVDLLGAGQHGIYLNDGNGVFTHLPDAGVEHVSATAGTAVFLDVDGDARLDLFIGLGATSYLGRDVLLLGQGDGTFVEASERLPGRANQPSNGSVACDFDDDGDLDLFVATYSVSTAYGLNHLWQNDGTGHFTEVGVAKGFASLPGGNYHLSTTGHGADPEPDAGPGTWIGSNAFGVDCADLTGDGYLDVFLGTISHPVNSDYNRKWSDPSQLLVNQGPDGDFVFTNEFLARGLPFNEGDLDAAAIDFDNDGRLDLSISRERKYEGNYTDPEQKGWFGLMHQQPDGTFASVGLVSGINDPDEALLRMKGAQNHAWSDIDGDGDLDLLVGGRDQGGGRPNFLFRNEIGHQNRWLKVRLEGDGVRINRDAIGARVTLRDEAQVRVREKRGSRGLTNSEDTRVLHFGLDGFDMGAVLDVRWPDGSAVSFTLGRDFGDDTTLRVTYPDTLTLEPPAAR